MSRSAKAARSASSSGADVHLSHRPSRSTQRPLVSPAVTPDLFRGPVKPLRRWSPWPWTPEQVRGDSLGVGNGAGFPAAIGEKSRLRAVATEKKRLVARLPRGQAERVRFGATPSTRPRPGLGRGAIRIGDGRRPTMPKVRDAIRLIEQDGWTLVRTRGSHRQYRHRDKPGTVTVAGKPGDDLSRGTWASVMKQAGLKG